MAASPEAPASVTVTPDFTAEDLRELATWIESTNPDLNAVEARAQGIISE
jgi:hypothetical protein